MFDQKVLVMTSRCFNMLRASDLIYQDPQTNGFYFTGFKDDLGDIVKTAVRVTSSDMFPIGVEMMLKDWEK